MYNQLSPKTMQQDFLSELKQLLIYILVEVPYLIADPYFEQNYLNYTIEHAFPLFYMYYGIKNWDGGVQLMM